MKRNLLCIFLLLTLAPLVATTTLVCSGPTRFGITNPIEIPIAIVCMAFFGLITVPLWLTYIPTLILTPIVMTKLSRTTKFQTMSLPLLLTLAAFIGLLMGLLIFAPILYPIRGYHDLLVPWAAAGATSGLITFPSIAFTYRYFSPKSPHSPT